MSMVIVLWRLRKRINSVSTAWGYTVSQNKTKFKKRKEGRRWKGGVIERKKERNLWLCL
jgi:hypothetical protein